jgi:4'-phosphopantetheinyl transferase
MNVRIWLTCVDNADPSQARNSLSPGELKRAEEMASPQRRRSFLARRQMARQVLAEATGTAPAELVLERRCERCGELHPASPLGGAGEPVWWSASRSEGLAAIAIAHRRVGLDLERRDARPRWERIARRFFSAAEHRAIGGSPERFLELWTLKEAYLKALGLGLPGGLRALECTGLEPAAGGWSETPARPGWRFRNLEPAPGFIAALAVEGAVDSIELRRWEPDAGGAG